MYKKFYKRLSRCTKSWGIVAGKGEALTGYCFVTSDVVKAPDIGHDVERLNAQRV